MAKFLRIRYVDYVNGLTGQVREDLRLVRGLGIKTINTSEIKEYQPGPYVFSTKHEEGREDCDQVNGEDIAFCPYDNVALLFSPIDIEARISMKDGAFYDVLETIADIDRALQALGDNVVELASDSQNVHQLDEPVKLRVRRAGHEVRRRVMPKGTLERLMVQSARNGHPLIPAAQP